MAKRRRRRNWTADPNEAAQYAMKRWGHAHYLATKDRHRDVTWPEFADFIRQTGDVGADEVADAIEDLPGATHDYPVWAEPIGPSSPEFVKALTPARSRLNPEHADIAAFVDDARDRDWKAPRSGGLADGVSVREFPRGPLIRGTLVEFEHTRDPAMALRISMDHLTERLDYYDLLEAVERAPRTVNKADLLAIPRRGRMAR